MEGIKNFIKKNIKDPTAVIRFLAKSKNGILVFKKPLSNKKIYITGGNLSVIKHIFFDNPQNYGVAFRFKFIRSVVGGNLSESLTTWEQDRESLAPRFNKEGIKDYVPVLSKTIHHKLNDLEQYAENNQEINIHKYFSTLNLNTLLTTIFGGATVNVDFTLSLLEKLQKSQQQSPFKSPVSFIIGLFTFIKRKRLKDNISELAWDIVKQSLTDKVDDHSIIKQLAKSYGYQEFDQIDPKTKKRLWSTAVSFLMGSGLISLLLTNVVKILSLYPLVSDKLYEEVKMVLGSRSPNFDDLPKLLYTQAVIKETLRLNPPYFLIRSSLGDDAIDGYKIHEDDVINVSVMTCHRTEKYWINPIGFDPERFLQPLTNEQKLMFMPFGFGAHNCLGAIFALTQTTLFLALLAQRYFLRLSSTTSPLESEKNIMMRVNKI